MQQEGLYVRDRMLVRPRIQGLMEEAARYPLCTVTAGTGYGKTQTVSQFLQGQNARHVWLQLTEMDNYIPRFWEIATHAFAGIDEQLAKGMRRLGFPGTPELLYKLVKLLQNGLSTGGHLYLALDDFHKIEEAAIVRLVETLAYGNIGNLTVLLLSRQPLPLDYFSLYNNGLLHRIAEEDLRFTYEETEAYYRLLDFSLSDRELTNIYESTEGWPTALYLVGLHRTGGRADGGGQDPLAFTMPFLNSLMEVEVFSVYPEAIQDVFVRLSLFSAVPLEIVKLIAGEYFAEVEAALHANMFVSYNRSVDNQFVFHRLFRRFLRPRRAALPAEERDDAYRLMAGWYYDRQRYSEALDYYEKCGDNEGQWAVMQQYARDNYTAETSARCIELAENFPPEFVAKNLMVVIHKGYMYLNIGHVEESARTFEAVLDSVQGDESETARVLAGEAWLGLAPVRIFQQSWEFVTCYEKAAELLPEGSRYMDSGHHYLGSSNALPFFSRDAGELDLMARRLAYIWPVAVQTMNGCGYGLDHLANAEASFYRSRFEETLQHTYRALYDALAHHQRDIVCASYFLFVRLYFAQGEYAKVMQYLCEMEEYLLETGAPHAWGVDALAKAWFYQRVGDFSQIPEWTFKDPVDAKHMSRVTASRERVVETDYLIRRKDYEAALARTEILLNIYEGQVAVFSEVKCLVYRAICLLHTGRPVEAATAFLQAARMAMPNDIRMTLVEEGADTVELVRLAVQNGGEPALMQWLEGVGTQAEAYAAAWREICEAYGRAKASIT